MPGQQLQHWRHRTEPWERFQSWGWSLCLCCTAAPLAVAGLYGGPGRAAQGEAQQQGVPEEGPRLLQVAVVGVPNAGKSTLTNALVGQKVSAVSSKTNTTFVPTLGAFTEGPTQVVLYDTPGVVGKRQIRGLDHEQRVRSAWGTAADCDELLFIIDAHRQVVWPDTRVTTLIQQLSTDPMPDWQCPPATLVLNKVDLLMKDGRAQELAPLCDQLRSLHPFGHVFAISALRRDGIDALRDYLVSRATPGEWTIEAGKKTEQTPQETVTEVVREKVFRRLHEELPYNIGIQHESWRNFADGSARVEQTIVVPTDQVRRIVVGKHGAVIGQIGKSARLELTDILKQPIHLILNVKVRR
ncbi:hypothetical protein WJX72_001635 [[Myrmecia] bisecta]|uniref:Uncharacterized protein n=1 Tax=[Myrmecia] bisecta TaxID=41462 RepID=A0AAW1QP43_9CHLO